MSYCRYGEDSDLYVIRGKIQPDYKDFVFVCYDCPLNDGLTRSFNTKDELLIT